MKTVSLVLGSGGARGMAHIGVIRWLLENDYEIKSISGCSAGALIGGVYAAGKLDEFEHWVRAITRLDMVMLLDISWSRGGLVKGDKFINTLVELVGNERIENLPIKYTAVAADIKTEKEVWINTGNLFDAIRASISLPLFFTPHKRNGIKLIDGGVLNPVPIAPTFGDDTDMTIAVNLGGKFDRQPAPPADPESNKDELPAFSERVSRYIQRLQKPKVHRSERDWGLYDVASQAFESMQSTIAKQKLAAYPPDQIIEIPRNSCGAMDIHRAAELIAIGYERARESMGKDTAQR